MFRPSENFLSTLVHRLLVGGAFGHHHGLALQIRRRRDRRRLRHHQLGAGHEHQRRERHLLGAFRIGRGRPAFEVDLVLHHRRNAVVRGDLDVFDLEVGVVDLDADLLDDRLAEFEAVADRPVGMIEERKRRRALAIAETHDMRPLDVGERRAKPFAAGGLGRRRRGQQTGCQQHAAAAWPTPSGTDACISPINGRPDGHRPERHPAARRRQARAHARPSARPPISPPRRSPASCRSRWWRCVPCRGTYRCP